jgi:hypothetical protein
MIWTSKLAAQTVSFGLTNTRERKKENIQLDIRKLKLLLLSRAGSVSEFIV